MVDLPLPLRSDDAPGHPRLVGLIVALAVAALVVAVEDLVFGSWITALGLLIAPYLGWCLGPDAAAFRRPARTVIEMAVVAVLVGAILIAWQLAGLPSTGEPSGLLVQLSRVGAFALLGVLIYGLPALALTSACSLVWYFGVRALAGGRRSMSSARPVGTPSPQV